MLFLDLLGSPLHPVEFDIFSHSFIICSPLLQQAFQIALVFDCQLGITLLLRRLVDEFSELIESNAFEFEFGLLLGISGGGLEGLRDELVDVGHIRVDSAVDYFAFDECFLVTGLNAT